jgi:hypothetical protein
MQGFSSAGPIRAVEARIVSPVTAKGRKIETTDGSKPPSSTSRAYRPCPFFIDDVATRVV